MKKILFSLLMSTFVLPLLFSGGSNESGALKIGVTIYKYDDNFMAVVRKNMEAVASEIGVELLMNDSQNDQAKQNDQVDVLINKGVNALAINLVDPAAAGTIIAKAKQVEMPVVFFNKEPSAKDLASYDHAYYVGTNSKESGIIQGEMIFEQWSNNPAWDTNSDGILQYVLLKGEPGHPDAEARTTYVITSLNDKGAQTEELYLDTGMWDAAMARDKVEAWISGPKSDSIEVVIANNDAMAFGAIEALRVNNRSEIPVFGVDALAEALEKIKAGEMAGTVLNDAENQARATVELAANLANGNDPLEGTSWILDEIKAVRVPYVAVDGSTIE